jgi:hypothetical protein
MSWKNSGEYVWLFIAICAGANYLWPELFTKHLFAKNPFNDAKWAVIKKEVAPNLGDDDNLNKKATIFSDYYLGKGYTFHDLRKGSGGFGICGSFQRSDNTGDEFFFTGGVFIKSKTPNIVSEFCDKT